MICAATPAQAFGWARAKMDRFVVGLSHAFILRIAFNRCYRAHHITISPEYLVGHDPRFINNDGAQRARCDAGQLREYSSPDYVIGHA